MQGYILCKILWSWVERGNGCLENKIKNEDLEGKKKRGKEKLRKNYRKNERNGLKNVSFWGYRLKNFANSIVGEKNESQKRGGGKWSKCTIYIPEMM